MVGVPEAELKVKAFRAVAQDDTDLLESGNPVVLIQCLLGH